MKKNLALRLGAVVLIMSVITLSLVSGTFAKYTREIVGSDSATVANFEFDLTKNPGGIIADEETLLPLTFNIFDFVSDDFFGSGVNGDGDKLIAPGTEGTFDITLKNNSEVAVNVAYKIEETANNAIPVYYTLGADTQRYSSVLVGETYGEDDVYMPLTGEEDSLAAALGEESRLDPIGGGTTSKQLVLKWCWLYESEDFDNAAAFKANDEADTQLGVDGVAELELTITTTVTQVDPVI